MPVHLQREIDKLKRQILSLCALVEGNVRRSVKSFTEHDAALAQHVVELDESIDSLEVDVEEECLKILALHQPVAVDLRYIIAMLKINHDLERIGDLAVNIAEYTLQLAAELPSPFIARIGELPRKVEEMVRGSIEAIMEIDANEACEVWQADDEIDATNRELHRLAESEMDQHPEQWRSIIACLGVSRCLERIADHAANMAKDVIYLVEGRIVRHRGKEFKQASASGGR
jgi:phosphate transport system protein